MSKIYTPGVRPVRYTGEHPYVVRELKYARFESVISLEKGDIVFLPLLTAVTLLKRKRRMFESVEHLVLDGTVCVPEASAEEQTDANLSDPIDLNNIDTSGFLNPAENEGDVDEDGETETVEAEQQAAPEAAEDAGEDEVVPEAAEDAVASEAEAETSDKETVVTKENIMDESLVSLVMIKEACKVHNIKIGNKKRGDLVALLLPYLDN